MGGSSIVTIRPTRTRSPPGPVALAVPAASRGAGRRRRIASRGTAGDDGQPDQVRPTLSRTP